MKQTTVNDHQEKKKKKKKRKEKKENEASEDSNVKENISEEKIHTFDDVDAKVKQFYL